jgi:heme/copper-type cytochrome/quinol oxidase subunit 2
MMMMMMMMNLILILRYSSWTLTVDSTTACSTRGEHHLRVITIIMIVTSIIILITITISIYDCYGTVDYEFI